VTLGTFNEILSYFVFVVVIFIALTVVTLFMFRRREPGRAGYLTPGYPVTPVIFLFLILVLLVLLGSDKPKQAFMGVGVVALGLPVYFLLFRHNRISTEIEEGN
ncbi:MAG: APC family permease, partial [Pyrinomonadaceae bacterium]